jgi:putative ABC transport system permease protein
MRWEHWLYTAPLRLRSIFRKDSVDSELDEELRYHIESKIQQGIARGLSPEEAHLAAMRAMDGIEQKKEEARDMRRIHWLSDFLQDLRYASRGFVHARGFTALVTVTLALGIGVNAAIFSMADGLVLRPLPVRAASQVVSVGSFGRNSADNAFGSLSYRDYLDYRDKSKSFDGLVAFSGLTSFGVASQPNELPRLTGGMYTSANLFRVMGVEPELGRGFLQEEERVPGRDAVVVLGHDFWEKQFGGDPSAVGRRIRLNGVEFTVVGVAPKRFTGMDQYFRPAVFVPWMMWPRLATNAGQNPLEDRGDRQLNVKGRLKPGVSINQARAELEVIAKNLERAYPATDLNRGAAVRTELELRYWQDPVDASLAMLMAGLAAAVLLVACANVASLLLSRARVRSREIAVRLAIGAGRWRMVRLLLTESLLLALVGGLLGIAVAYGGVRFIGRFQIPTDLPLSLDVQLDQRALLFCLLASVASAVLFGLAPALQTTKANLVTALKAGDVDVPGHKRLWGRNALVVGQVAAALMLLTVSAVNLRAIGQKLSGGPGFRTNHLMTMSFDPALVRLNEEQTRQFYREVLKRARLTPGVKSAALTAWLPMSNTMQEQVSLVPEEYQMPKGKENVSPLGAEVDEHYFDTMDVKVIRGRGFEESDTANSPRVAVVNEEFAKHYWPGRDPIGKRFRMDDRNGPLVQIVGLTRTAKYAWIAEPPMEFVYLPLAQRPHTQMTLLAESSGDSASLAAPLRDMVRGIDANQPVFDVRTIEDYYEKRVVFAPMLIVQVMSALGLTGLVLALAGLYGVVAYAVSRRTREIGIRMAIGANRGAVLRLVLRQGLTLVTVGTAIGLVLGLLAERGLNAVFATSGVDFAAYAMVVPALMLVAMLAAYLPARRASRVDPMRALRYE